MSYDFVSDAKEDFFILKYNWHQAQSKPIGNVDVKDYTINILTVDTSSNYRFDNQKTYVINDQYYFRAAQINLSNNEVSFRGINWINEYPRILNGTIKLGESDLKLIQNTGHKIAMIGDSQMGWREGRYTRKWIAKELQLRFLGSQMDVFGYPYFYSIDYSSDQLNKDNLQFSDAEILILFLGLRENRKDFHENIKKFITSNQQKKIILIQGFSSEDQLSKLFNGINTDVITLNLSDYSKPVYYQEDGKHLNFEGHKKLAKELVQKLKAIGVTKN
ncbi:MAG: hypothetical protein WBG46_10605 [Nonlabens sp.]